MLSTLGIVCLKLWLMATFLRRREFDPSIPLVPAMSSCHFLKPYHGLEVGMNYKYSMFKIADQVLLLFDFWKTEI